jgi:hypothetical protein
MGLGIDSTVPYRLDRKDVIKKNTGALIDTSKEAGLGINTEKTKHMSLSHRKNTGQNHDVKIADIL